MIRALRAAPTLLRIAVAEMAAYRAEMIIWILSATLPLVMLALWNAASEGGPLAGFSQAEFARYFVVTLVVRQATGTWVVWQLNESIRTGSLSPQLLRPVNPLVFTLAETAAALPWRLLVLTPILAVLLAWRPDIAFAPTLAQAAAFVVSVALAFWVSWVVQCVFGMLAFWFDQSLGLFQVWFALWAFLGGYVIPLPLLPDAIADVARWLPFRSTLGAPVEILLGIAAHPWRELAIQAGWAIVLTLVVNRLWVAGLRRYGAVGA